MALIDTTAYQRELTPELTLRQIFVKSRLNAKLRRAVADKNLIDVDSFTTIVDTLESLKVEIEKILGAEVLGAACLLHCVTDASVA